MFDAELYQISKETVEGINDNFLEKIKRNNLEFALTALKKYLKNGTVSKEGVLHFSIHSNGEFEEKTEHRIFVSIITTGFMRYLEEELCLYLIKNDSVMSYPMPYNTLEFIWDAKSYFVKNMAEASKKGLQI